MGRVMVVGSSNTDMILQVPDLPRPGETVLGGRFSTAPGGKGANQAVAAARAGAEVSLVVRVGKDVYGERALAGFAAEGIDTRFCSFDDREPSGIAQIFVARSGENCIGVASGANANLTPQQLDAASEGFRQAAVVLLQLETPVNSVEHAAAMGQAENAMVILNPAPACELPENLYKLLDMITPNETEAELLTGIEVSDDQSAAAAAAVLHERGVATVLITRGAQGVYLSRCHGNNAPVGDSFPAFTVEALDTTGAGDVFNGCLAAGLGRGETLESAVRTAQAATALSVQVLGAQNSAPYIADVEAFMKSRES